jgi:hypothetical protein
VERKSKKQVKKLVLRKETLRLLEEGQLKEVGGGTGGASLTFGTDCCCNKH